MRRRALERLYERREAVLDLINSIEGYQRTRNMRLAQCVVPAATRR